MTTRRIAGLVLIVIGVIALVSGGVFWTERETVVDAGPLQITADDREGFAIPPIVGILSLIGGIALMAIPERRRVQHAPQEECMAVRMTRSVGMLLLGIYLVLVGLGGLVAFGLPPLLMAALALIAGALILVGR